MALPHLYATPVTGPDAHHSGGRHYGLRRALEQGLIHAEQARLEATAAAAEAETQRGSVSRGLVSQRRKAAAEAAADLVVIDGSRAGLSAEVTNPAIVERSVWYAIARARDRIAHPPAPLVARVSVQEQPLTSSEVRDAAGRARGRALRHTRRVALARPAAEAAAFSFYPPRP